MTVNPEIEIGNELLKFTYTGVGFWVSLKSEILLIAFTHHLNHAAVAFG
jgi:hypothetical protein